jgi:hypothetical protein
MKHILSQMYGYPRLFIAVAYMQFGTRATALVSIKQLMAQSLVCSISSQEI